MNGIVLVSGIPGAGKTTVARLLARRMPRIWSHLGESMRRGLGGVGLWLDNGARSAEETAAEIERRLETEAAIA